MQLCFAETENRDVIAVFQKVCTGGSKRWVRVCCDNDAFGIRNVVVGKSSQKLCGRGTGYPFVAAEKCIEQVEILL